MCFFNSSDSFYWILFPEIAYPGTPPIIHHQKLIANDGSPTVFNNIGKDYVSLNDIKSLRDNKQMYTIQTVGDTIKTVKITNDQSGVNEIRHQIVELRIKHKYKSLLGGADNIDVNFFPT